MAANASIATPLSVPPSQQWDGNDGPWSSFSIHVGTPPQSVRVLVSTTVGETWVVSQNNTQGGCLSTDPSTCPNSRGGLVNVNASSTWQDQGIFALGSEQNLPDYIDQYANGDYGLESLGIGIAGSGGVTLDGMVVAALATKDWYIGNLGVNQQPTNFSTFSNPHPSFLKSLKTSGKIPSLSYAYTAGNQYRDKKVFGSLTLGGCDDSKFVPNGNSFEFAGDISRDLVVGLQSITYTDATTTNKALLSSGIYTFVDATVPHIWLPVDACQAFEKAFGITYNSTANRYLVNDTQHAAMQTQNASVSFILGNSISGGATVNITLPYAAFDLATGPPIASNTTKYFPLRQAANNTQYTLGRAFLQEAYLIVDYERSNFSISEPTFSSAVSNLVAIEPVSNSSLTPPGVTKTTGNNTSSIPTGAIVGIVIAAIILVAGAIGTFFFLRRRRGRSSKGSQRLEEDDDDPGAAKPEMDGQGRSIPIELFGSEGKFDRKSDPNSEFEMEGSKAHFNAKLAAEMEGSDHGHEMAAGGPSILTGRKVAEMEGEGEAQPAIEMYAGPQGLYELDSPVVTPSTGRGTSAGLPTPASEGTRRSDGMPSPMTPAAERRRSIGRITSWARRSKPVPDLPRDESIGEDGISGQDEPSSIAGPIWSSHRTSRPLGSNTAYRSLKQDPPSSRGTSSDGRGESTRDRHRRGADALTKRLESSTSLASASAYGTPMEGLSPTGSPRPEDNSKSRYDNLNERFGPSSSQQRGSEAPSPRLMTPRERTHHDSSQSGWGGSGGRRPSDQSGLMSPVSPADDGPTGRIPSPRIPRSGGGGGGGGRSPRPPDPPAPPSAGFF